VSVRQVQDLPTAEVARFGRIVGQGGRNGYRCVTIPIEVAKAIHKYLASRRNAEYSKNYRKL